MVIQVEQEASMTLDVMNSKELHNFLSDNIPEIPISNSTVLFLDIDGVLNSMNYFEYLYNNNLKERFPIDPCAKKLLEDMVIQHDFEIVLSSTWRMNFNPDNSYHITTWADEKLSCILGETIFNRIIDVTPIMSGKRGTEIQYWLDNNGNPDYIILDDDSDMLDNQLAYFVKTNNKCGLTAENVR